MSSSWIAGIELAAQIFLIVGGAVLLLAGIAVAVIRRAIAAVVLAGLAAMCAGFVVYEIHVQYALAGWTPVPCSIVTSQLDRGHVTAIAYQYEVGSDVYIGHDYRLGDDGGGPPLDAAERAALAPGARRTCYVAPDDTARVVVSATPYWEPSLALYALLAAGLLLAAWLSGRSAWRQLARWRRARAEAPSMPRAVARVREPRNGDGPR